MLKTNLNCSQAAVWWPSISSLRRLSDLGVRQLWPLRYLDHSQILFIIGLFFPLRPKLFMYWAALISWVFLFPRNLIWKQNFQVQALNETGISNAHGRNSFRVRLCTLFLFSFQKWKSQKRWLPDILHSKVCMTAHCLLEKSISVYFKDPGRSMWQNYFCFSGF